MPASPTTLPLALLGLTWSMIAWGFALGGIPILIHLLHRRKYRETTWAAMRFLIEAARKHSRRIRIEQLILLAVRTLILLFLVGALQGLYAVTTNSERGGGGPVHHVLVLDASMSMHWNPAGRRKTLFDRAKQTALTIVDSASDGDAFNLLLITGSSDRAVVKTPVRSRRGFRDVIQRNAGTDNAPASIAAGEEPGRLLETLREVEHALTRVKNMTSKRVYVISDFQKVSWRPESQTLRERIRKSLQAISSASLVMIDVGRARAGNTAVTDLRTDQPFVIAGRPLRVHSQLRNFGPEPLLDRTVELLVDGQVRDVKSVTLGPGLPRDVAWTYPNPKAGAAQPELTPGEHRIAVRLQEDGLTADNVRRLAIPVKRQLRVLLVNGRSAAKPRDEATFFVRKALQPSTSERQWKGIVEPRAITESELLRTDLTRFDCVFLCDVRALKQSEARKLRSFVEAGGGLVIGLGERVDIQDYNAVLFRDGNGLLPAKLAKLAGSNYETGTLFRFDATRLNHPIVDQFVGNPDAGLDKVFTFRYVQTELPDNGAGRVVLRFRRGQAGRRGDPAVIEAALGRGRVVLVATSLDARWTTWPATGSYLPIIHEILYFAVAGQWKERQHAVGDAIIRAFPAFSTAIPRSVAVKLPDASIRAVSLSGSDRWFVKRPGADFFEAFPEKGLRPAGRIPSETPVRRVELRKEFSRVGWRGRNVWVRNATLKRRGNALFFFDDTRRSGFYEVRFEPPLGR
ncbi:MAG: BatA domain-containing protein, partial [Planctomycetaceae bacterium]